jgi:lipid A oxidase
MQAITSALRRGSGWTGAVTSQVIEKAASLAAIVLLCSLAVQGWIAESAALDEERAEQPASTGSAPAGSGTAGREIMIAGYVGAPLYYRSNVHITRPGGTDLELKKLGWDGDALYFPIDGGVRSVEYWKSAGFMIDFMHNKAIARLGKGAHGRKLSNPVIEEVEASGTLNGKPAPARVKLTDVVERLEFTHGHNVLLFTPLVRLFNLTPDVRPYLGIGAGFAIPHVEVWFPGEPVRTNEYQYAGPAAQAIAGLELRAGKWSYFIEYKFTWASISGALTGDESWLNSNMPGDLLRQFRRWWAGEEPKLGRFHTHLSAHQIVAGAGYWFGRPKALPSPP